MEVGVCSIKNHNSVVMRVLHYFLDSLEAGGTTAMMDGLLESLKEILQNGKLFYTLLKRAILRSIDTELRY